MQYMPNSRLLRITVVVTGVLWVGLCLIGSPNAAMTLHRVNPSAASASIALRNTSARPAESARCAYGDFDQGVLSRCMYSGTLAMLDELQRVEQTWGVRFLVMHGSLIGQAMNSELLPWDRDLDMSILDVDEPALRAYLASLRPRSTSGFDAKATSAGHSFFTAGSQSQPLEWFYDSSATHHIEYRLTVSNPCNPQKLSHTDVTVLYRQGGHAAHRDLHPKHHWAMKANLFRLWGGHTYADDKLLPLKRCKLHHVALNCPFAKNEVLREEYGNFQRSRYKTFVFENGCWQFV